MATYRISGIWKDAQGDISHVMLHGPMQGNNFSAGQKKTSAYVINLIESDHEVYTTIWKYVSKKPQWQKGAEVEVVGSGPYRYLRSIRDATERDNLESMINMEYFF